VAKISLANPTTAYTARHDAAAPDELSNRAWANKASCLALAEEEWRSLLASAKPPKVRQALENGPARRFVIDRIVAAVEPLIRADERRACADLARNFLPIRSLFDASFAAALDLLADQIESRRCPLPNGRSEAGRRKPQPSRSAWR
jgi:hypothetical protein